jgi:hypothetical protein
MLSTQDRGEKIILDSEDSRFPYHRASKTCRYDPDNEMWFGGGIIEKFKVSENIKLELG